MKRLLYILAFVTALLLPLSVEASGYVGDNVETEESTKVNIEDVPFVKSKKVSVTSKKFTKKSIYFVRWKQFPGADGYQFNLCVNKSFKKKYKPSRVEVAQTVMQVNKVKKKVTYYYKIRAFKDTPSGRVYSKWTKVYSIKRKK